MRSQLNNFFKKCVHSIKTKPLQRGMAMYAVTYPTGSFIQQLLNKEQEKIDYRRIGKFTLFGSLVIAPGVNLWVNFVNRVFVGNSILHILGKVGLEQIIWAPIFYTVFYFGLTVMDGRPVADALLEVKTKAFHTYTVGLMVWPFLQLYNYSHVSDKNRIVFMAFFGLIWTVYLSYTKYVLGAGQDVELTSS
ncbi:mpv17-like protein [Diaphorina citri]|jgi:Mpv17 / PMP22 family.|uniref:Mpv17-like protein n=1 Tax=Diaphorina citri TaxID=121845 RepID=A0A1S3D1L8_DIACI|nr:mpv17-like protein [Diaphorina citri]